MRNDLEDVNQCLEPDGGKSPEEEREAGYEKRQEAQEDAITTLNRRTAMNRLIGAITFSGLGGLLSYGVAEATDGDGSDIDWDSKPSGAAGTPGTGTPTPSTGKEPDYILETGETVGLEEFGENCLSESQYQEIIEWAEGSGRNYNTDELEVRAYRSDTGLNVDIVSDGAVVGTDEYSQETIRCEVR